MLMCALFVFHFFSVQTFVCSIACRMWCAVSTTRTEIRHHKTQTILIKITKFRYGTSVTWIFCFFFYLLKIYRNCSGE